jgi:hypothetical protein
MKPTTRRWLVWVVGFMYLFLCIIGVRLFIFISPGDKHPVAEMLLFGFAMFTGAQVLIHFFQGLSGITILKLISEWEALSAWRQFVYGMTIAASVLSLVVIVLLLGMRT